MALWYTSGCMLEAVAFPTALLAAIEDAERSFPEWSLDREEFGRRALDCLAARFQLPRGYMFGEHHVGSIHLRDLYLAHACACGIPGAIAIFAATYLSKVPAYLRQLHCKIQVADEVRRELEDRLLFSRAEALPRIAQYEGGGPLDAFVSTAARRAALSLLRAGGRQSDVVDAVAVPPAVGAGELSPLVRGRYEAVVREAFRASLAAIDQRQRTIVRLHVSKGISLTLIATMLHIHQSTVSRSFDAALRKLRFELRRQLQQRGVSAREAESIVRDVRGHLDLSLSRLLRDTATRS